MHCIQMANALTLRLAWKLDAVARIVWMTFALVLFVQKAHALPISI